jgi:hypothetical protein
MDPSEPIQAQEKKLKNLEMELNDLRQGLAVVTDYYRDLQHVSGQQDAAEMVDQAIVKPLVEEDIEFEGIWQFHEDILIADPLGRVPCSTMYEAFVAFCIKSGRSVVDQDAFEFVFARLESPAPSRDRNEWIGYSLRPARE